MDTHHKLLQRQVCGSGCGLPSPMSNRFPSSQGCWVTLGCMDTIFASLLLLSVSCGTVPAPSLPLQLLSSIWSWNCLGWLQIFSADVSQGSLESTKMYLQTEHITQVVGILQRSGAGVLKALGTSHA